MKAIAAVTDANMDLHLNLKSNLPDGRKLLTFIRPGTESGLLLQMIKDLPFKHVSAKYLPLSRVQIFAAQDQSLWLNIFVYGEEKISPNFDPLIAGARILNYAQRIQSGEFVDDDTHPAINPLFEREGLIEYISKCSESFVARSNPQRFLTLRLLYEKVSGTEGTTISIDNVSKQKDDIISDSNENTMLWVNVAVANSLPQVALEQTARLLYLHNFDVQRAHLDIVSDTDNGMVTLLRMLVQPMHDVVVNEATLLLLKRELKRSKWLDPSTASLVFDRYPWLGVKRGEIITAFCSLMHPIMAKKNNLIFSKANILETVTNEKNIGLAAEVADLFLDRFNPKAPLSDEELESRSCDLITKIKNDTEDTNGADLLEKMIEIVKHTLKTNIYLKDRYTLGFRLDPAVLVAENETRELPYGVIFAHGRRFNAYHVRFRDIARGGLRLVTPSTPEQYALESSHQYDECYGLAFAQQLKNKDIPEGGAKAVLTCELTGLSEIGKNFVKRKSVKAFTDSILDLVVETEESKKHIVDFLGKKEIIYLGPDEQIIPEDIEWIIKRANRRGYTIPAAFMSSKPRAGINHKEYGVTSEGVHVFLDVALRRSLNIDPLTESFTIKMTGGPDGDVAGNEIKILIREYGDNAKIVGIADHSGCAEDPEGLEHEELLYLVKNSLSIVHFNDTKLGPQGVVHNAETEQGFKARNSMHNRLEADAFVPAGGRPNTIDIHNYTQFLKSDGTPSSPLIVEGANLFITSDARQALFEDAGVIIVKDSSANKCGVITSSYEICAAMMLTEDEFYSQKEQIVEDVLNKLRGLAKMEAELLFREFENFPGSLPHMSQVISNAINTATDAIVTALDDISESERQELMPLFRAHLPKSLVGPAFDQALENVPEQYIKNAIASHISSKMVYKEGTQFIENQHKDRLAQTALLYIKKEKEIAELIEALGETDMQDKEKQKIVRLLEQGGTRTALALDLQ